MATEALREAKKRVVPLGVADPSLSFDVCRIVDKAMAYDPAERFSSYEELIAKLENALKRLSSGQAGEVETSASVARRRAKKKQGELLVMSVAGLALFGAVASGIWWITRDSPAPVVKVPVAPGVTPIIPESTSAAATDIAKTYREARAAVEAREFDKAAAGFVKLREDATVQEPTRTWAGVEAVVAKYLAGQSSEARKEAKATSAHASTLEDTAPRVDEVLTRMLEKIGQLPAIPAKEIKTSENDASHVIAWMLAGLKNWEQGMLDEAAAYFSAVASAKISSDEQWLGIYQNFAREYLVDRKSLSAGVFDKLPADVAGCEAAVAELDGILEKLKTRGRARFNVRAWQLDLAKHAKLLAAPKLATPEPVVPAAPAWDPVAALEKVDGFSKECRFAEAAAYLKSFADAPPDATRASLLSLTEAAAVFLADLKEDLVKQPMVGEFPLRSGESVRMIAVDASGNLVVTDSAMQRRATQWWEFSADALIGLHRTFVKNPKSESERLRRHECAIAYDWLAGDRDHALTAAATLAQGSPAFKQRWDTIALGLPK